MTDQTAGQPIAGPGVQGVHVLVAAQRLADQLAGEARLLAAQVAGDAEVRRDKILAEAEADAARIRRHAEQDADQVFAEAREAGVREAQDRCDYYRSMGDALCAQVAGTIAGLSQTVAGYEAQPAEPPGKPARGQP